MSFLREEIEKSNLDLPEGEIKIDGVVNPTYANAINVHNKKKKEIDKVLKDKKPELKKPFIGAKGTALAMPKTKDLKKLKLSESIFEAVTEDDRAKWISKDKELARDLWTSIYNELNGEIKGIEAKGRRLKATKKERYGEENIATQGETIKVYANDEKDLDFAKKVADTYGVEYQVNEHTGRYATFKYSISIYTDRPKTNESLEEAKLKGVNENNVKGVAVFRGVNTNYDNRDNSRMTLAWYASSVEKACNFGNTVYVTFWDINNSNTLSLGNLEYEVFNGNGKFNNRFYSLLKKLEITEEEAIQIIDRSGLSSDKGFWASDFLDKYFIVKYDNPIREKYEYLSQKEHSNSGIVDTFCCVIPNFHDKINTDYNDRHILVNGKVDDYGLRRILTILGVENPSNTLDKLNVLEKYGVFSKADKDFLASKVSKNESLKESIDDVSIKDIEDFIAEVKDRFNGAEAHYDGDTHTIQITLDECKKNESLNESANDVHTSVAKHFNYHISDNAIDVMEDLVKRALDNESGDYAEDVYEAIDEGLIYNSDIWAIKELYEEAKLEDTTYEELVSDILSIVTDIRDNGVEESLTERNLTRAERHNRNMDRIFDFKKNTDSEMEKFLKSNTDLSQDEIEKLKQSDKLGEKIHDLGLWDEWLGSNEKSEGLKSVNESSEDEVTIDRKDSDFHQRYFELKDKGYKTVWSGEGKIRMKKTDEKPEPARTFYNEDLKVTSETDLTDFNFWSGAEDTAKYLTDDELRTISSILEDSYPDGMSATAINDFFWFEDDTIAEWLGYDSFEDLMEERDNEE